MSYKDVEKEVSTIPIAELNKPHDLLQEEGKTASTGSGLTIEPEMTRPDTKPKTSTTNLRNVTSGDLEIAGYAKGHRNGGGLNSLAGFGELGEPMKGYPKDPTSQPRLESVPEHNYETERLLHYIYKDTFFCEKSIKEYNNKLKRNPITYDMLSKETVRSHQKGLKLTSEGVHGKHYFSDDFKIKNTKEEGKNFNGAVILDESVRSRFGFQKKYEHDTFGTPNIKITGAQLANTRDPNPLPQNKITRAMNNKRGDFPSGRYAGLNAI